jgi:hypothetical protein
LGEPRARPDVRRGATAHRRRGQRSDEVSCRSQHELFRVDEDLLCSLVPRRPGCMSIQRGRVSLACGCAANVADS